MKAVIQVSYFKLERKDVVDMAAGEIAASQFHDFENQHLKHQTPDIPD